MPPLVPRASVRHQIGPSNDKPLCEIEFSVRQIRLLLRDFGILDLQMTAIWHHTTEILRLIEMSKTNFFPLIVWEKLFLKLENKAKQILLYTHDLSNSTMIVICTHTADILNAIIERKMTVSVVGGVPGYGRAVNASIPIFNTEGEHVVTFTPAIATRTFIPDTATPRTFKPQIFTRSPSPTYHGPVRSSVPSPPRSEWQTHFLGSPSLTHNQISTFLKESWLPEPIKELIAKEDHRSFGHRESNFEMNKVKPVKCWMSMHGEFVRTDWGQGAMFPEDGGPCMTCRTRNKLGEKDAVCFYFLKDGKSIRVYKASDRRGSFMDSRGH